ncbi:hypothetical protein EPN15_03840 [Patescibacteria group bacterium]|nr:MAG: hypothetical protein EPN15_03840 [Patescibacteria group bacterium]
MKLREFQQRDLEKVKEIFFGITSLRNCKWSAFRCEERHDEHHYESHTGYEADGEIQNIELKVCFFPEWCPDSAWINVYISACGEEEFKLIQKEFRQKIDEIPSLGLVHDLVLEWEKFYSESTFQKFTRFFKTLSC